MKYNLFAYIIIIDRQLALSVGVEWDDHEWRPELITADRPSELFGRRYHAVQGPGPEVGGWMRFHPPRAGRVALSGLGQGVPEQVALRDVRARGGGQQRADAIRLGLDEPAEWQLHEHLQDGRVQRVCQHRRDERQCGPRDSGYRYQEHRVHQQFNGEFLIGVPKHAVRQLVGDDH